MNGLIKSIVVSILLVMVFFLGAGLSAKAPSADAAPPEYFEKAVSAETDWDAFIRALAWVESRWDDNAVSNRQAVGYLQVTPVLVNDANRIVGNDCFHLEHRNNRQTSMRL